MIVTAFGQNSTPFLLVRPYPIETSRISRQSIVACVSCSTLFWIVLVAAFIVTELAVTAILVHLSTGSLPDRCER
jgi:Na+(H+)/acetate symporter ActP